MDLGETEASNDCAGEDQQQFNRLTDQNFLFRITVFEDDP
jgi:hypothetical protein